MRRIVNKIFPRNVNNEFTGNNIALYAFYVLTVITLWRSQHHIFAYDGGAQSIATVPLSSFSEPASESIVALFALWGLSQLIVGLVYLVIAVRYRSLIPFMYLLMIIEYSVRATYIESYKNLAMDGVAPGALGNIPIMILSMTMFLLCFIERERK